MTSPVDVVHSDASKGKRKIWVYVLGTITGLVGCVVTSVYGASELQMREHYEFRVAQMPIPNDAASLERGRHLVEAVAVCTECHGTDLGGKIKFERWGVGTVAGPNLTRGRGSRTVAYNREDWFRSVRHGVGPDGLPLRFMPSSDYALYSLEDIAAIISYVESVPPVDREMKPTNVGFLMRLAFVTGQLPQVLAASLIDHEAPPARPMKPGPTAAYGERLAVACKGCHGAGLSGGPIPGAPPDIPPAANLTFDRSGLGAWSAQDFERVLRTGTRPDGRRINELMPWRAYSQMQQLEIEALWSYLKSLPQRPWGEH